MTWAPTHVRAKIVLVRSAYDNSSKTEPACRPGRMQIRSHLPERRSISTCQRHRTSRGARPRSVRKLELERDSKGLPTGPPCNLRINNTLGCSSAMTRRQRMHQHVTFVTCLFSIGDSPGQSDRFLGHYETSSRSSVLASTDTRAIMSQGYASPCARKSRKKRSLSLR